MGKNAAGLICYVHICLEPNFQLLHPLHCWVPFHPPGEHVRALYQSMEGGWLIVLATKLSHAEMPFAGEDMKLQKRIYLKMMNMLWKFWKTILLELLGYLWVKDDPPPYGPNNHDI